MQKVMEVRCSSLVLFLLLLLGVTDWWGLVGKQEGYRLAEMIRNRS